ncbi:hypothetical protein IGI04_040538 [Brassica rapa subsp. trilocularis]|uniref:Uncharacterized protein n=1 Tax=Brassica rapa subsp. trilocularis TaxID=1813537 RepID=A0ABQ7KPR5_BRACM|nr:hypothetical protein IGI04_040538 [Brassica rapa subsp. trilocularis]
MKQGVPITSDLLSQMKLVTKLGLEKKSSPCRQTLRHLLNPKCRVWCLDIDRRYLCTSIDINLHLSRHFLISISSTDAYRSIILPLHKYKVNALPWEYRSQDARISDMYLELKSKSASIAGSVTKIGQASMNQNLMSSLRKRALKTAASKSRFELFYLSLYESSLNGFSHQGRNLERENVINNLNQALPSRPI